MHNFQIYKNNGNFPVLDQVENDAKHILDVGCGAGDNARLLQKSGRRIVGVTIFEEEIKYAISFCNEVILADIEKYDISKWENSFDTIILSHVCEHLVNPTETIRNLLKTLQRNGKIIVAVPNMSFYRNRLKLLKGDWSLSDYGPFDKTHLHFYDFLSIDEMCATINGVSIKKIPADFAIPLWPIRKFFKKTCKKLDLFIGRKFPNLFCQQTILIIQFCET